MEELIDKVWNLFIKKVATNAKMALTIANFMIDNNIRFEELQIRNKYI